MNESHTTEQSASFEDQLARLKSVLDTEHQALLAGDAKTVASLAVEKEHLAEALATLRPELPASDSLSREIKQLAKQVDDLAKLNHVLLEEVYQYYHGMLELFMRLGGRGQTYGRNGILSVDTLPKKEREILA
jgi:flagellar biosynthesis/type III secretory pathway chaperone